MRLPAATGSTSAASAHPSGHYFIIYEFSSLKSDHTRFVIEGPNNMESAVMDKLTPRMHVPEAVAIMQSVQSIRVGCVCAANSWHHLGLLCIITVLPGQFTRVLLR